MARKGRAPKYAGALAQPIYLDPDDYKYAGVGLGQPPDSNPNVAAKKMREMVQTQTFEKMRLLFEHYKIDPSDEQCLEKLAIFWRSITSLDCKLRTDRNPVANRRGRRD